MRTPAHWTHVARLPAGRLGALTDRALARYVREELLPFSSGYRELLERAGGADLSSRERLADVPPVEPADLRARPEHYWLRPSAAEIAARGSFSQRLALRLGGLRAARALAWGYAPVTSVADSGPGPRFVLSAHDVALAGESGARALGELGLQEARERLLVAIEPRDELARLALFEGAVQLGARCEFLRGEDPGRCMAELAPSALVGRPAELTRCLEHAERAALSELRLLGILGSDVSVATRRALAEQAAAVASSPPVAVAALFAPAWARQIFAERPAAPDTPSGFTTYPDLGIFEVLDDDGRPAAPATGGALVYSAIAGHGLPAFRYRTGLTTSAGLSAPNAGVPRLSADLVSADWTP